MFNSEENTTSNGPRVIRRIATELNKKGFTYEEQLDMCLYYSRDYGIDEEIYIVLRILADLADISMRSIAAENPLVREFLETYEEGV
jgi:hypothetical protein